LLPKILILGATQPVMAIINTNRQDTNFWFVFIVTIPSGLLLVIYLFVMAASDDLCQTTLRGPKASERYITSIRFPHKNSF
jgi:hypothetical protein